MAKDMVPVWGSEDEGSSDIESDEVAYEIERIIAQRTVDGEEKYLVKWSNFGDEECTWEPLVRVSTRRPALSWLIASRSALTKVLRFPYGMKVGNLTSD